MVDIFVDGQKTVLKKDSSFEFVAENRLFSGADSYTLSITFPLEGCPSNLAVFGHVNRHDVFARKVVFDCEIRAGEFVKAGSLALTDITESEVTGQFLEGRSERNFERPWDKVYINELDLGRPESTDATRTTPLQAWAFPAAGVRPVSVPLPWVNSNSAVIQNRARLDESGHWVWNQTKLSYMPYLIDIVTRICSAVGYRADLSQWENDQQLRYIIVCNALPAVWNIPDYARALPHWTVQEFFEKLELFLPADFEISHRLKEVVFSRRDSLSLPDVHLDRVVDEFSVEIDFEDPDSDYRPARNRRYKECSHRMWPYYACRWFVKLRKDQIVKYDSLAQLVADNRVVYEDWKLHRGSNSEKLLYAADVDMYFVILPFRREWLPDQPEARPPIKGRYRYYARLQPLNNFGEYVVDEDDDAAFDDIDFVPVRLDDTAILDNPEPELGQIAFLDGNAWDESDTADSSESPEDEFIIPMQLCTLEAGEQDSKAEYFDRIFFGWWNGVRFDSSKLPHPYVYDVEVKEDWSGWRRNPFSFRLTEKAAPEAQRLPVERDRSVSFSFLSDTVPDPRAVFYIRGKRYICEKITAVFEEWGMSPLLKGVFWPLAD